MRDLKKHCGGQHHFIGACNFHLTTLYKNHVVSTVGEYQPYGAGTDYVPLGSGPHIYETMVFEAAYGDNECGIDWEGDELECVRYMTAREANAGHFAIVEGLG